MKHLAACVAALLLASCNFAGGPTITEHKSIDMDRSESTRLDLKIGAGELKLAGGAAKKMEAEFAYSEALKPTVESRTSGATSEISVSQAENGFSFGHTTSRWDVRLNDSVPVEVVAKLGAGQADMTLGSLNLRGVNMDIGVGQVNVDLRGTPKKSYDVRINGGIGEAKVFLPRSVGITANAKGGIGEVNVEGLEKRGDRWINPGHENDPVQITLDAKGGIGEIRIVAQ
jgi:N-terminal domain of toast_rack, DUF2154